MNKQDKRKAALTGAAVGTALGVGLGAAAVVFSDKKKRQQIIKKTQDVKNDAERTLTDGKQVVSDMAIRLSKSLDTSLADSDASETVKKNMASSTKTVKKLMKHS